MLEIKKWVGLSPEQWEIVIEGMRNPKNSWDRMDSEINCVADGETSLYNIGPKDHALMESLANGGPVHAKYRRMIDVWVTINAPLYWWKEFDTYKVGTVSNSCSTMHKIHAKEFTMEDFSTEHLAFGSVLNLRGTIDVLNAYRDLFVNWDSHSKEDREWLLSGANVYCEPGMYCRKDAWYQMIQLLPSSYNQMRTIKLNYEVLHNMYIWRKNHKLDEWHTFCDWIKTLPYSELITMEEENDGE